MCSVCSVGTWLVSSEDWSLSPQLSASPPHSLGPLSVVSGLFPARVTSNGPNFRSTDIRPPVSDLRPPLSAFPPNSSVCSVCSVGPCLVSSRNRSLCPLVRSPLSLTSPSRLTGGNGGNGEGSGIGLPPFSPFPPVNWFGVLALDQPVVDLDNLSTGAYNK